MCHVLVFCLCFVIMNVIWFGNRTNLCFRLYCLTGASLTASVGNKSVRPEVQDDSDGFRGLHFLAPTTKSAILGDIFASVAFTAQHGTFQRLFSDLTRFHARLEFPSGFKFLSGATCLVQDFFNSQRPSLESIQAVCPSIFVSVQQQVLSFPLLSPLFKPLN